MGVQLGHNVLIYKGTTGTTPAIAAAKSCQISKKVDLIEKSSTTQGNAKEWDTGLYEWEVTMNHLVVSEGPFEGILAVKQSYTLRMTIAGVTMTGTAICMQADLSGGDGLAKGTVKFKGNGELTPVS